MLRLNGCSEISDNSVISLFTLCKVKVIKHFNYNYQQLDLLKKKEVPLDGCRTELINPFDVKRLSFSVFDLGSRLCVQL